MCGIAGMVNHEGYDLEQLKSALLHRGPDSQDIYVEKNIALIHTRLAIQDIAGGAQPFHYKHYSIVFNGEIYNHKKLREKLIEFEFTTHSDTETLLFLYIKYGADFFKYVDGMFAFCIYDRNAQILFFARDRAGKKPLYYYAAGAIFAFASELNAISVLVKPLINQAAIYSYLRAGFIYKTYTPYQNVHKLLAGTYMILDLQQMTIKQQQYFNILHYYEHTPKLSNFADALSQVEAQLQEAVISRLLASDVEVGAFLSGGIDSNLIVAIAAKHATKLKTFTVKFPGLYDESHLAKLTSQRYQTDHQEIDLTFDINNEIENILIAYGEPFMDSSAIPSYYVAKAARSFVKVILNGDGADELFAGYRRYVPIAHSVFRFSKYLATIRKFLPYPKNKKSLYNYLYRLLSVANKQGLDFYLSTTSDIYEDVLAFEDNVIAKEMDVFINNVLSHPALSSLSKALCLDFNLLLFSDLLIKMDIATMAHSLEGRSPFLASGMLNIAAALPDEFKIKRLNTKYILRQLAKKYLPVELIQQPKRGFEVPLMNWVNTDLQDQIAQNLLPGCYAENYIPRQFINDLVRHKHRVPAEKRAKMLWNLFCLEVWHRNYKRNASKGSHYV